MGKAPAFRRGEVSRPTFRATALNFWRKEEREKDLGIEGGAKGFFLKTDPLTQINSPVKSQGNLAQDIPVQRRHIFPNTSEIFRKDHVQTPVKLMYCMASVMLRQGIARWSENAALALAVYSREPSDRTADAVRFVREVGEQSSTVAHMEPCYTESELRSWARFVRLRKK